MSSIKILLLKTDHTSHLASRLCEIFVSSPLPDQHFKDQRLKLTCANLGDDLIGVLKNVEPHLCFILPTRDLLAEVCSLLQFVRDDEIKTRFVAVMEGTPGPSAELLRQRGVDLLTPPLEAADVLRCVRGQAGPVPATGGPPPSLEKHPELARLVGRAHTFLAQISKIPLIAKCDANVLISGETGTGKEICARAVHYLSARAGKPFVPVNCGAIPSELVENELFGHERGAFTGASSPGTGLIREADGGTLFLDEIDCLPLLAQVKLLRFIQEREYRPLGSSKLQRANPRIIAATNVDFLESIEQGRFRRDLYYRLNVIPLMLPPLRDRIEDVPLLAQHFLTKYAAEFGKPAGSFSAEATQKLVLYDWPGNVRELENVVERAIVFSERAIIEASDINLPNGGDKAAAPATFQEAKTLIIRQFELAYIHGLLLAHRGNVSRAARAANKNRRAFWQLICKHHIDVQQYRFAVK